MTTKAAEKLYLATHLHSVESKGYAIFNPQSKDLYYLPKIYGFNNGGRDQWYEGILLAEDGTYLGGHLCSHERYMEHDLGILEGSRPDRHESFKKHYPDGYRMDFIGLNEVDGHEGLRMAYQRNQDGRAKELIKND